jgi:hypothetical protein
MSEVHPDRTSAAAARLTKALDLLKRRMNGDTLRTLLDRRDRQLAELRRKLDSAPVAVRR